MSSLIDFKVELHLIKFAFIVYLLREVELFIILLEF